MKAYTDINQSRELAKFLPHESADQTWERIAMVSTNLDVSEELQYRHNENMPFKIYSGVGIPCWSLAALLDVLNKTAYFINENGMVEISFFKLIRWRVSILNCGNIEDWYAENPVDACYEMILKLHEQKLL